MTSMIGKAMSKMKGSSLSTRRRFLEGANFHLGLNRTGNEKISAETDKLDASRRTKQSTHSLSAEDERVSIVG